MPGACAIQPLNLVATRTASKIGAGAGLDILKAKKIVAIASAFAARLSSQKMEKEGSVKSTEARTSAKGKKKLAPIRKVSSDRSSMTSSSSDESPRKKAYSPLRKAVVPRILAVRVLDLHSSQSVKKKVAVSVSVLLPAPQKTKRRKRGGRKSTKGAETPEKVFRTTACLDQLQHIP
ncbi:hypothetical protein HZS_4227 [Henneguya salminicola]|nr:hypothetical protein HZS_4227 [Henneguya salminicola]